MAVDDDWEGGGGVATRDERWWHCVRGEEVEGGKWGGARRARGVEWYSIPSQLCMSTVFV